jgi:hypothetical protein
MRPRRSRQLTRSRRLGSALMVVPAAMLVGGGSRAVSAPGTAPGGGSGIRQHIRDFVGESFRDPTVGSTASVASSDPAGTEAMMDLFQERKPQP